MKIYIDIETARTEGMEEERKNKYEEKYQNARGLFPEFSKIICISVGVEGKDGELKIKSFSNEDEKVLLTEALVVFRDDAVFVGHNVSTFDIPFLIKRFLINKMEVPKCLRFYGKKPWDIEVVDTAVIWKSTSLKFTSLDIVCKALGVETPKQGIDGSQVQEFYDNGKLSEIVEYCERDVVAVYDVYKILSKLYI